MDEYWHVPVEVGPLAILLFKGQFRGDVLHAIWKKGQLNLRHRGHLSSDFPQFGRHSATTAAEGRIVAKSYRTGKPGSGATAVSNKKSCAYAGCAVLGLP